MKFNRNTPEFQEALNDAETIAQLKALVGDSIVEHCIEFHDDGDDEETLLSVIVMLRHDWCGHFTNDREAGQWLMDLVGDPEMQEALLISRTLSKFFDYAGWLKTQEGTNAVKVLVQGLPGYHLFVVR